MHRFYAPFTGADSGEILLEGAEAHHALHVLRVRQGESATVLDGRGAEYVCEVTATSNRTLSLRLLEKRKNPSPECQITLLQAIPKGKTFDNIIHKATELGVARIIPVISEHVIARPDASDYSKKSDKWQTIAIEAIKQCGQPWLPSIEPIQSVEDAIGKAATSELQLIGSLHPGSKHPSLVFGEFQRARNKLPSSVAVWIGPEGDFTRQEVDRIVHAGASPVTLGKLVLKCETAALYTLSVVNYVCGAPRPL